MARRKPLWVLFLTLCGPAMADFDAASYPPYERCALCHGLFGQSHNARFPHLAGQKPLYLRAQLDAFLSGHRTNDGGQMSAIVTELQSEEIQVVVDWFSTQDPPPPGPPPAEGIGETLVAELGCFGCHGMEADAVPYLTAQHAGYLEKQMTDFATGARDGAFNHKELLAPVATDYAAMAAYLSSLERNR